MIIRDCAVDSATLTIDTELTRMSHCGSFEFQGRSDLSTLAQPLSYCWVWYGIDTKNTSLHANCRHVYSELVI